MIIKHLKAEQINGSLVTVDGVKEASFEELATLYLEEDLKFSQRIEAFKVYAKIKDENVYREIYSGTVIGSGKIIRFPDFVEAEEIIITPTQSRKNPILKKVLVFSAN